MGYLTPIVPVLNSISKIRLCEDYKVSLDQNLIIDEHPLPITDELFNKRKK